MTTDELPVKLYSMTSRDLNMLQVLEDDDFLPLTLILPAWYNSNANQTYGLSLDGFQNILVTISNNTSFISTEATPPFNDASDTISVMVSNAYSLFAKVTHVTSC